MATFLFRINGGEVLGAGVDPTVYANQPDPLRDFVVNPPTPDGEKLSVPKIWDLTNVRNATTGEIAAFIVAAAADQVTSNKQDAEDLIDVQLIFRKAFKALTLTLIDEINILRAQHSLPDRTLAQAVTAIKSKISNGDVT